MTQDAIAAALRRGRLVDITTTGRQSGRPHRVEIPYFNVEERLFIIGDPRTHDGAGVLRPRDWYANLLAEPSLTIHLKRTFMVDLGEMVADLLANDSGIVADVAARGLPIRDPIERRRILEAILPVLGARGYEYDLEDWVQHAPIMEVLVLEA